MTKTVNRASYKSLQVSLEQLYFTVNGQKIHCFSDTPHLLKGLGNNFRKYNIKIGNCLVSWKFVENFYQRDQLKTISLAPKLTSKHEVKEEFSDMRVKVAVKVFSRTVAAGLYTHSTLGFYLQKLCTLLSSFIKLIGYLTASTVVP